VRIADLLAVVGLIPESSEWWRSFNQIAKKHVDFVVCARSSMKALVIIELDDRSHASKKAQKRDNLVNEAFKQANLPIIRMRVGMHGYDTHKLAALLTQSIHNQHQAQNTRAAGQVLVST
jgi:very-short-patch-repair endonuclease